MCNRNVAHRGLKVGCVYKVLLADDHDLVRTGIGRMLADIPDITVDGEATSGEEAVALCRK